MNDPTTVADAPTELTLPLGLIAFEIENITPGADTTLTIYLPAGSGFDTFYKYGGTADNPTEHWYEFMYDETSDTGAVYDGDTVTLYLKDGQRGDDDLTANGTISDPGGPVILQTNENTDPTPTDEYQIDNDDTTSTGSSGGCFINSIF